MLSFPAQNWEKVAAVIKPSPAPRNSGYGRVASRITPRLYISDYFTATDASKLQTHGITHVISVIESAPTIPDIISSEHRLNIALADRHDANILEHLDHTTAWITSALAENETNKVLVHCMQGISRSATVICAYLVATTNMTAIECIAHVQSIRGIVNPNTGFRRQLQEYSTQYVKLKSQQPALPEVSKLGGGLGIAARIRRLREISKTR